MNIWIGNNTFFNQIDPTTFQTDPWHGFEPLGIPYERVYGHGDDAGLGSEPASIVSGLTAMLVGAGVFGDRRIRRGA